MKILAAFLIGISEVASVYGLTCYSCSYMSTFNSDISKCESGFSSGSTRITSTSCKQCYKIWVGKGSTVSKVYRGCSTTSSSACDDDITIKNMKLTYQTSDNEVIAKCCKDDRCNSEKGKPPPSDPNTFKCYSCNYNSAAGDPEKCEPVVSGSTRESSKSCKSCLKMWGGKGKDVMVTRACMPSTSCSGSLFELKKNIYKLAGYSVTESCCKSNLCNSGKMEKASLVTILFGCLLAAFKFI